MEDILTFLEEKKDDIQYFERLKEKEKELRDLCKLVSEKHDLDHTEKYKWLAAECEWLAEESEQLEGVPKETVRSTSVPEVLPVKLRTQYLK